MKKLIAITLLLVFTVTNGCSVFRHRNVDKNSTKVEQASKSTVSKVTVDSTKTEEKGVSNKTVKKFTEDITYKTPENYFKNLSTIELTGNFTLDSSPLSTDTVVKILDVGDSKVSLTVYQNKKTNQMMAKVTSNNKTQEVPFSEITIKRNYSEENENIDTTKTTQKAVTNKLDSVGESSAKTKTFNKTVSSKLNWQTLVVGILFLSAIGYLVYRQIKKVRTIKQIL